MKRRFVAYAALVGLSAGFSAGVPVGVVIESETSQRAILALGECIASAEAALAALQGADDAIHDRMAPPLPTLGATEEP